jgi:hypothetical protein
MQTDCKHKQSGNGYSLYSIEKFLHIGESTEVTEIEAFQCNWNHTPFADQRHDLSD